MLDWQPDLYLEFKNERTQPSIDLVNRIDLNSPKSIIDMGCGPGNSTQVLVNRWPGAEVVGMDYSTAMIEKAKQTYPDQAWQVAQASTYKSDIKYDLLFSNAVIQWIPNHKCLLQNFHALLSHEGVLAVQVPQFWEMPLGKIIDAVANEPRWEDKTRGVSDLFTLHGYPFYYDILSDLFGSIEMWVTHYLHIMDHHQAIIQMMRGTGLKPYFQKLDDSEKSAFEADVLNGIIAAYPAQKDGKVILPFNRLFFIAKKI